MPLKHRKKPADTSVNNYNKDTINDTPLDIGGDEVKITRVDIGVQTDPVIIKEYNGKNKNMYVCTICSRNYKNELDLAEHKRVQACIAASDKTYCASCDMQLGSKESLRDHILTRSHMEAVLA